MNQMTTEAELEHLREERIEELRTSSDAAAPFQGRDLLLVATLTLIIPGIALIWGWFAWV